MTNPSDPPADVTELGYQEALDELERLLDRLETDRPDVDQIAEDVARAAALVEHCRGRIHAARERVETVVEASAPGPDEQADDTGG